MSEFVRQCRCKGEAPSGHDPAEFEGGAALLRRMRAGRHAVRYLLAPPLFGKSRLAARYAAVEQGWGRTVWVDAADSRFASELSRGSLALDLAPDAALGGLIVFDGVGRLGPRDAELLWQACAGILEAGGEVIVTADERADPLGAYHASCITVRAHALLLPRPDDSGEPDGGRSFSTRRVRGIAHGEAGCEARFLERVLGAAGAESSRLMLAAAVLGRGGLSELVRICGMEGSAGLMRRIEADPLLGVDLPSRGFGVEGFSLDCCIGALRSFAERPGSGLREEGFDGFLLRLADGLSDSGRVDEACALLIALACPAARKAWLVANQRELIGRFSIVAPEELCESLRGSFHASDPRLLLGSAIRQACLGDAESAVGVLDELAAGADPAVASQALCVRAALGLAGPDALRRFAAPDPSPVPFSDGGPFDSAGAHRAPSEPVGLIGVADPIPFVRAALDPRKGEAAQLDGIASPEGRCWILAAAAGALSAAGIPAPAALRSRIAHELACRPRSRSASFAEALLLVRASELERSCALAALEGLAVREASAPREALVAASAPRVRPASHGGGASPACAASVLSPPRPPEGAALAPGSGAASGNLASADRSARARSAPEAALAVAEPIGPVRSAPDGPPEWADAEGRRLLGFAGSPIAGAAGAGAPVPANPPVIRVQLLGQFRIVLPGRVLTERDIPRYKARAVCALLCSEKGHELGIYRLAELAWPESSEDRALHNLSSALSALTGALRTGEGACPYLRRGPFTVSVSEELVESDVDQLSALCRRLQAPDCTGLEASRLIEELLVVYQGDLLPGKEGIPSVEALRLELRERFIDALVSGSSILIEEGRLHEAIGVLQRALSFDPGREDCYALLIECQSDGSRVSEAAATWLSYCTYMRDSLGLSPSLRMDRVFVSFLSECREAIARGLRTQAVAALLGARRGEAM